MCEGILIQLPEPRRIKAKDVFISFLIRHHKPDLLSILKLPSTDDHLALQVNFMGLMQQHVEVAEAVLSQPERLLPVLESAALLAQQQLLQDVNTLDAQNSNNQNQLEYIVKENLHPRLAGVPCSPETRVPRAADAGSLLCFSGTVVRVTVPRLLRHTTTFTCELCHHTVQVQASHDQHYIASRPPRCPNPDFACFSRQFSAPPTPDAMHTLDYQEIKLQEMLGGGGATGSGIPQCVWVTLHYDLVDTCKPGDDVLVCGSAVTRWKPLSRDVRPSIDIVIKANNVTVRNKQEGGGAVTADQGEEFEEYWRQHRYDPFVARDLILASVCPQVYGLFVVKLSVAVVLAGGVQRLDKAGTRVRGEPHLLLVGDPGTGKSQLLQWACSAGCRAVLTTGVGSTAAGLTVAAVREPGGDWGLEAGALVLADGGLCCIDEFSSVREADRAAIHEAMEQQTISVAKAGMVCKLNSRCSVVAATNPKGRYDPSEPLNLNVGVASPLLSRFDLILVLRDTNNAHWDKLVSSYILSGGGGAPGSGSGGNSDSSSGLWSLDKMRAYFRYIKRLQPKLATEANAVLSRFYQMQRNMQGRDQSRTTIRLLESLVRLSQGHARLMLRSRVTAQDAVVAVLLWEAAMTEPSIVAPHARTLFDPPSISPMDQHHGSPLHASFPADPRQHYITQATNLLHRLQLPDVLSGELSRLEEEGMMFAAARLAAICGDRVSASTSAPQERTCPSATVVAVTPVADVSVQQESGVWVPRGPLLRGPSISSCLLAATQDMRQRGVIEELEDQEEDAHNTKQTQVKVGKRKFGQRSGGRKNIKDTVKKQKETSLDSGIKTFLKSVPNEKNIRKKTNRINSDNEEETCTVSSGTECSENDLYDRAETILNISDCSFQSVVELNDSGTNNDINNDNKSSKRKFPDSSFCVNSLVKKRTTSCGNEHNFGMKDNKGSSFTGSELHKTNTSMGNFPVLSSESESSEFQANSNYVLHNNSNTKNVDQAGTIAEDNTIGLTQKAKKLLQKFACSSKEQLHPKSVTSPGSGVISKQRNLSDMNFQARMHVESISQNDNEEPQSSSADVSSSSDIAHNISSINSNSQSADALPSARSNNLAALSHMNSSKTSITDNNACGFSKGSQSLGKNTDSLTGADKIPDFTSKLKRFSYLSKAKEAERPVFASAAVARPSTDTQEAQSDGVLAATSIGGGLSTAKRSCFHLTTDVRSDKPTDFLWAKKQSTEKSFGKFASSQELDDEAFGF